jgi:hypothetical protein
MEWLAQNIPWLHQLTLAVGPIWTWCVTVTVIAAIADSYEIRYLVSSRNWNDGQVVYTLLLARATFLANRPLLQRVKANLLGTAILTAICLLQLILALCMERAWLNHVR